MTTKDNQLDSSATSGDSLCILRGGNCACANGCEFPAPQAATTASASGDDFYLASDGVEHSHPDYGQGVFFTHDCRRAPAPSREAAVPLDLRQGFERHMSNRGEAVNYEGDGLYASKAVNDQADAFRAGVEFAQQGRSAAPQGVAGEARERFEELVRDLYNFQGGRHFALRLEKLLEQAQEQLDAALAGREAAVPLDDADFDQAAAEAMDRVSAARGMHALEINADVREHHTLRRELVRAGYRLAQQSAPQPAELSEDDLYAICDAYESGIGHGLQRDGHKSGAAFSNPACGKAYELGYLEGEERAKFQQPAATDAEVGDEVLPKLHDFREDEEFGEMLAAAMKAFTDCPQSIAAINDAMRRLNASIRERTREYGAACVAADRARRAGSTGGDVCAWTVHEEEVYWRTACGREWVLIDGTPADNRMDFCHGCGKPLAATPSPQSPGGTDGWKKLANNELIDWNRKLDVVLDSGVYEYQRDYQQIDWTQVRDWRYSPAGEAL